MASSEEGVNASSTAAHHHHHHVSPGVKPHLVVDEAVVASNREMEMTAADYLEEEHRRGGMCVRVFSARWMRSGLASVRIRDCKRGALPRKHTTRSPALIQ